MAGATVSRAVVIGGSIAGLAAARLLTRHFSRVVVVERDVRPDVAIAEAAFAVWDRPSVPQFRHSHAFLARLRLEEGAVVRATIRHVGHEVAPDTADASPRGA